MNIRTRTYIAAASIGVLSLAYGIGSYFESRRAYNELWKDSRYAETLLIESSATQLRSAVDALKCRKLNGVPLYPDTSDAIERIADAEKRIAGLASYPELRKVRESLPVEPKSRRVVQYKGVEVNDSTFEPQRRTLDGVATSLTMKSRSLKNELPSNLLSEAESISYVGPIAAGIAVIGAPLYMSKKRRRNQR